MIKWSTTDKARLNGIKVLVYGEAGAGKTTLCATAPSPVILSAESGLLSLRNHQIPVMEISTLAELTEAYEWLTKSHEASYFQTVCLDSLTEIAELVLTNAKKQVKDPRQAYGELIDKMMGVVKAFRDIDNKNIYMAAKCEQVKDEMTGAIRWSPSMPGAKLGGQLPYLFDEVFALRIGRTDKGEYYRYLQTSSDLQFMAKDRSGALAMMEQPDLSHIFNKIRGPK